VKIGAPKEVFPGEARVAMTPDSALALQKLGHTCFVEAGAGARAGISDAAYAAAGVGIVPDAAALFAATDVITKVRPPVEDEVPHPDVRVSVVLPYDQGSLVSRIHTEGEVLTEEHLETGTRMEARVGHSLAAELNAYLVA